MSFVISLTCGHAAEILAAEDVQGKLPPADRPWILFPMPDGDSIDPGDGMSCITCLTAQIVTGIYDPGKVEFTEEGKLKLP